MACEIQYPEIIRPSCWRGLGAFMGGLLMWSSTPRLPVSVWPVRGVGKARRRAAPANLPLALFYNYGTIPPRGTRPRSADLHPCRSTLESIGEGTAAHARSVDRSPLRITREAPTHG